MMNEYLIHTLASQRIDELMRDAGAVRIAERDRHGKARRAAIISGARALLQRLARSFSYPAGAPASWRDTSRA